MSKSAVVADDLLLRGLYEALITSVTVASLFSLPSFVSLFEGEAPAWKETDTSRMRHAAWPLLKDPDSLIVIQQMMRCLLLMRVCWGGVAGIRTGCGTSTRARMLSSAGAVMFIAAYLSQMYLFQFSPFRLEGPIGGLFSLGLSALAVALLTTILIALLTSGRLAEAVGALVCAPCILSVSFWFACENYLELDARAGQLGNAAFSLSALLDTAGCVALLCGPCLSSGRLSSFLLGPVVVFQQALGLYYFLDSLEMAPQSTLSFAAAYEEDSDVVIEALPMKGNPEQLLISMQFVQFSVAFLGMLVYSLRSSTTIAHAVSKVVPLLDIGAATPVKDSEVYSPEYYKQTFDV